MKIKMRDVGLLAVGFVIGAVVAVSLTTTPTAPPVFGTVATGPVLAAASLPPRFITITNIQWETPPIHIVLPTRFIDSFNSQSSLYPPTRRNVDLIDMRYQPDIKLDDLK